VSLRIHGRTLVYLPLPDLEWLLPVAFTLAGLIAAVAGAGVCRDSTRAFSARCRSRLFVP